MKLLRKATCHWSPPPAPREKNPDCHQLDRQKSFTFSDFDLDSRFLSWSQRNGVNLPLSRSCSCYTVWVPLYDNVANFVGVLVASIWFWVWTILSSNPYMNLHHGIGKHVPSSPLAFNTFFYFIFLIAFCSFHLMSCDYSSSFCLHKLIVWFKFLSSCIC